MVHRALADIAAVLADPADAGAEAALDAVHARWHELAPEEREALTPVARLAAARVRGATEPRAAVAAEPGRAPIDVAPDELLGLLGLSTFRPGQREAVQAALDG